MSGFWGDLKLALRVLRRSPSYVLVALLTLGLGIGATTAIFSVVDGVLLRPLPYRDPARLLVLWESAPMFDRMSVSYPDYLDWEKSQTSLEALGCFRNTSFNLTGTGGTPERLHGMMMSATLLPTLGLAPQLGRSFTADEDREDGEPVAMLGHGFWQRQFGGSPEAVGRTLRLSGTTYTVVGVLPADFRVDTKVEVVTPIGRLTGGGRARGNHPGILGIARLKPGVTIEQARADLESSGRAIGAAFPGSNGGVLPAMRSMHDHIVLNVRAMLLVLMGAVVLVLLIAVVNVANLALARGTVRRREMSVRAALGAGTMRLVRQVLVESAIVSLLGGALGVLLALWGVDLLNALRPDALPEEAIVRVDVGVLAFAVAVSLGAGMLFGVLPALQAVRSDFQDGLKDSDARTATASRSHRRTRNALVIAEVALALMLLVGAGLSVRGFVALSKADPGFRPDDVVTMSVQFPVTRYPDRAALTGVLERIGADVRALPGVASASLSAGLPLAGSSETGYNIVGEPPPEPGKGDMAVYFPTDGAYRETMGLKLLAGRFIEDRDVAEAPLVVVIDEHLARTGFAGRDPIGQHLLIDMDRPLEIVGVVGHVNNYGFGQPEMAADQLYLSWRQIAEPNFVGYNSGMQITLRTTAGVDASGLVQPVTRAVAAIDPEQPVFAVQTMNKLLDDSASGRRFAMSLLAVFAAIALVLAAVGLYSVLSYLVAQRQHEVGIRMALGARPGDVERMVVKQGLGLVAIGLVLGTLGALALTGFMASILYGITATDPLTYVVVAGILALVALLASWLPARRAARVDPMVALRGE